MIFYQPRMTTKSEISDRVKQHAETENRYQNMAAKLATVDLARRQARAGLYGAYRRGIRLVLRR